MIALFELATWLGLLLNLIRFVKENIDPKTWARIKTPLEWTWEKHDENMNREIFPDSYISFDRITEVEPMPGWPKDQRQNPAHENYQMSTRANYDERLFFERVGRIEMWEGDSGHFCRCLYEQVGERKRIYRFHMAGRLG